MSPFWNLLELRYTDVVVTTEGIRHANLQSDDEITKRTFKAALVNIESCVSLLELSSQR